MIEGFRHKGLKRLYEEDDRKLLPGTGWTYSRDSDRA
jgi:hypothetical protein